MLIREIDRFSKCTRTAHELTRRLYLTAAYHCGEMVVGGHQGTRIELRRTLLAAVATVAVYEHQFSFYLSMARNSVSTTANFKRFAFRPF